MRALRPHLSDTLAPGQRIGPFVLLAPMGVGGSGRIWAVARVGQLGFNKRMVLKVMRHDKLSSERARERFEREACLGGRLSHANVRAVHDLGSHEGRPFMALSWVDTSLEELLEHAPGRALPPEVVCWIGMQCCSALSAAHDFTDHDGHRHPIVHRDVSPGNILLSADGHALLADLTAPAGGASASPGADVGTRFFGSLAYAAPEALKQEPLDGRADLFSLGAVLFEALSGSPAFEGDDERQVVFQILEGAPLELARRVPGIADDLANVIHRCLERRPELRFQSARELRAALSACCNQRSAFSLEQRAASLVREVLGGLIREREEALHLAFQRFAPSPFERTDTLPIASAGAASRALQVPTTDASQKTRDSERDVSRSGAAVAIRQRKHRRRGSLWVVAALAALLALYGVVLLERAKRPSVAAGGEQGPSRGAGDAPLPAEPSVEPPRAPAEDTPPPRAPAADTPPPRATTPAEGVALKEAVPERAPKPRPPSASPRARAPRAARTPAEPSSGPRAGAGASSRNLDVRFEQGDLDNPYDNEAPAPTAGDEPVEAP